jgi:hypothetical protein
MKAVGWLVERHSIAEQSRVPLEQGARARTSRSWLSCLASALALSSGAGSDEASMSFTHCPTHTRRGHTKRRRTTRNGDGQAPPKRGRGQDSAAGMARRVCAISLPARTFFTTKSEPNVHIGPPGVLTGPAGSARAGVGAAEPVSPGSAMLPKSDVCAPVHRARTEELCTGGIDRTQIANFPSEFHACSGGAGPSVMAHSGSGAQLPPRRDSMSRDLMPELFGGADRVPPEPPHRNPVQDYAKVRALVCVCV